MSKRWLVVALVPLFGACSLLGTWGGGSSAPVSTPVPGVDETWTGSVRIVSSSVPAPYNWSREAQLTTGEAALTVSFSETKDSQTPPKKKTFTHTLTAADVRAVNEAVQQLQAGKPSSVMTGSCSATVKLVSSKGRSVQVVTAGGSPAFTAALSIWRNVAGPDDPQLPDYAYKCQG